ncbi:MAG: hypothetical protein AAF513_17085 [Pseudomonadota bacterium]
MSLGMLDMLGERNIVQPYGRRSALNSVGWSRVALAILALLLVLSGCTAPAPDSSVDSLPRSYDGKPDLNGIWQAINTAHWNLEDHPALGGPPQFGTFTAMPPGKGVVEQGAIPYQDWALEQRQSNFHNRFKEDPEAKCYLPGVPRATYMPYPFHILQGTGKIMLVYGFAEANRTIHMDKADPIPAPIDSWMGRSHGYWDGDTLVVNAQGFNGQAWLDRAGNFASYALEVEERYTLLSENAMLYEATLTDPTVYTDSWRISMPLYRRLEADAEVLEYKCVEFSEELLYGHLRRGAQEVESQATGAQQGGGSQ